MGWGDGPVTARQFTAWREWRAGQWNEPDRGDHYLMSLTGAVVRGYARNPKDVRDDRFKLTFRRQGDSDPTPVEDVAEATQRAKERGFKRVGGEGRVQVVTITRTELARQMEEADLGGP